MRHIRYVLAVLAAALTYTASFRIPKDQLSEGFTVFVVGAGVQNQKANGEQADCSVRDGESGGRGIWAGAQAAWLDLQASGDKPQFELRGLAENRPEDSATEDDLVKKDAQSLLQDPSVLAVIGYPMSHQTSLAASIYSQGGIPLIMPVATSPEVGLDKNSLRPLTNCFRLPPSDTKGQAPAIAYFVNHILPLSGKRKVHLVKDALKGNASYSEPLCSEINALLTKPGAHNGSGDEISKADQIKGVAQKIVKHYSQDIAEPDDVVVFCGYYSDNEDEGAAKKFLDELTSQLHERHIPREQRPYLIFTDGAGGLKNEAMPSSGSFKGVYFADFYNPQECVQQLDQKKHLKDAVDLCPSHRKASASLVFGYDSVRIIHQAVNRCWQEGKISRACLRDELEHMHGFSGACSAYSFHAGESVTGNYYLKECNQDGSICKDPKVFTITPQAIVDARISGSRHE
jgi:ABC-type branched-subunit amino acid transport system substrate-binding protein